jgi:hypothetical protein
MRQILPLVRKATKIILRILITETSAKPSLYETQSLCLFAAVLEDILKIVYSVHFDTPFFYYLLLNQPNARAMYTIV